MKRNVYRVLAGKPEGRGRLGISGWVWEDNIKTDFKDMEYEGVDWITLAQNSYKCGALPKSCNEPQVSMKCQEFRISRRICMHVGMMQYLTFKNLASYI